MKMRFLVLGLVVFGGCAPRYSIRQIREYDTAISLAEQRGVDTTGMHEHLVDMLLSYAQNPGEDSQDRALSLMAGAQAAQAISSIPAFQPQYQAIPLSPMEYQRAVSGR